MGDKGQLEQILINLLSNAVKFCAPETGRVVVRLGRGDGCMRVDVEDNGAGIGAEHQALIFEKFRQVGDTLTQKPAGTGLGLAICRQIIAHFGGHLFVESEPGRGSVFSFSLPAVQQASAASRQAAAA